MAVSQLPLADYHGASGALRPSPPVLWVCLESLALTAAIPGLGFWIQPDDPFFVGAGFPWPIAVPLLLG